MNGRLAFARFHAGALRSDISGFHMASNQSLPWTGLLASTQFEFDARPLPPQTDAYCDQTGEPDEPHPALVVDDPVRSGQVCPDQVDRDQAHPPAHIDEAAKHSSIQGTDECQDLQGALF